MKENAQLASANKPGRTGEKRAIVTLGRKRTGSL
jgi:hypothetical protein